MPALNVTLKKKKKRENLIQKNERWNRPKNTENGKQIKFIFLYDKNYNSFIFLKKLVVLWIVYLMK